MDKKYFQLGAPEEHGKAIIVECRDQICSRPIAFNLTWSCDLIFTGAAAQRRALLMIANSYWTSGFKRITQRGLISITCVITEVSMVLVLT